MPSCLFASHEKCLCVAGGHLTGPWPALAVHGPICATISIPRCLSHGALAAPKGAVHELLICSSDLTRGMKNGTSTVRARPLATLVCSNGRTGAAIAGLCVWTLTREQDSAHGTNEDNEQLQASCLVRAEQLPWVSCIPIRPLSSAMRDDIFSCEWRAC